MTRRRKPLEQHRIDGSFRLDRHASRNDLQSPPLKRLAPLHLSPAAAACWDELLAAAPTGAFGESDAAHLEACAMALAHLRAAHAEALATPLIAETGHGPKVHAIHVEVRLAAAALNRLLAESGLTPQARMKVQPIEHAEALDAASIRAYFHREAQ